MCVCVCVCVYVGYLVLNDDKNKSINTVITISILHR